LSAPKKNLTFSAIKCLLDKFLFWVVLVWMVAAGHGFWAVREVWIEDSREPSQRTYRASVTNAQEATQTSRSAPVRRRPQAMRRLEMMNGFRLSGLSAARRRGATTAKHRPTGRDRPNRRFVSGHDHFLEGKLVEARPTPG